MLTCLVWQLASVFVAQFDQEVASYSYNSGIKAQRFKCCVTPGQRNSVIVRACARRRVCVCVCACACRSALFLCLCVSSKWQSNSCLCCSNKMKIKSACVWEASRKAERGRYREGGRASQGERERFRISCYVTFSCQEKQKLR